MTPHFRGLRVSKPYKTYYGESVVRVANSANTTLFIVLVHELQTANAVALVKEFNRMNRRNRK